MKISLFHKLWKMYKKYLSDFQRLLIFFFYALVEFETRGQKDPGFQFRIDIQKGWLPALKITILNPAFLCTWS